MEFSETPDQSEGEPIETEKVVQKVKSSKKRRLASTRGLSSLDRGTKSNSATPFNSPNKVPVISSTPISTTLVREAVPPP